MLFFDLVPEDRKRHGALLTNSIKNNINMPTYERISTVSVIDAATEKRTAEKYRSEIQIKCPTINQLVKNLSGGNQQKVIRVNRMKHLIYALSGLFVGLAGIVLATGGHEWGNFLVDGVWIYDQKDVEIGLRSCYTALRRDVEEKHGHPLIAHIL